jgi:putative aldouronate transport system permease protein
MERLAVPDITIRKRGLWTRIKMQKVLLLMLAPAFILVLIFNYAPLYGWIMAFTNYRVGHPIWGAEFTGLFQFRRLFFDSRDLQFLLRNTLVINVTSIVLNLLLAVVLTILLKEFIWKFGAKVVQTVAFFPFFISWVMTFAVVAALLSVNTGLINRLLVDAGILDRGINFLGSPDYSWGLMIGMNMWRWTGYNTIIFLAAISGISPELYESASLDGVNRFQKIIYITIPHLMPTLCVMLILNSGWVLNNNLEQFFIFTNATNRYRMEVLDMYIFRFGLGLLDFSYATAVGIMKSIVSLLLLFVVNNIVKRLGETSVF